jgi:hypothetical protein
LQEKIIWKKKNRGREKRKEIVESQFKERGNLVESHHWEEERRGR